MRANENSELKRKRMHIQRMHKRV